MDDMISRLSSILDDPEQAEKIKKIAASMMSNNSEEKTVPAAEEPSDALPVMAESFTQPKTDSFSKILSPAGCSRNVSLLNAIRPYMRSSRAEKIGSAIKAMEMIELLSKLK